MRLRRISIAVLVSLVAGLLLFGSTMFAQSDVKPAKSADGFVIGKYVLIERKDGGIVALEHPEVRTLAGKSYLVGKTAQFQFNDIRFHNAILWMGLDEVRQFGETRDLSAIEVNLRDDVMLKREKTEAEARANRTPEGEQRNQSKK